MPLRSNEAGRLGLNLLLVGGLGLGGPRSEVVEEEEDLNEG